MENQILERNVALEDSEFKWFTLRKVVFTNFFDEKFVVIKNIVRGIHRTDCHCVVGGSIVTNVRIN